MNHTYNVVGNCNEHGLIIGETTFGGLKQLDGHGSTNVVDYGSLIWVTLQRAKTAREAIAMMDMLCTTYGYASDGESFSIADGNEVWLMELIGKGKAKGAVWVASRVPEGSVGSTANQARTRFVARDDPENVLFAKDVVSFAQSQGLYPKNGKDEDFSFADAYDPITGTMARLAEARVWNLYHQVAAKGTMDKYLDYAQGYNITNRMPLFVPVAKKLSVLDTMQAMRTHFEGTWFDNRALPGGRADVGAGSGNSAYRWRPLTWESGGKSYLNERTVGVQQTAWAFVAQSRGWMPGPFRALFWFAPDDSSTGVRVPLYGGVTKIPTSFADPVGQDPAARASYGVKSDAFHMSLDSAFWVWNLVGNMAYGERAAETYPIILDKINLFQNQLLKQTTTLDAALLRQYASDPAAAVALATKQTVDMGDKMTKDWLQVWMELFSRFRDGFTVTPSVHRQCDQNPASRAFKNCTFRADPVAATGGYSKEWYARIVADGDNAEHYANPPSKADDKNGHQNDHQNDHEAINEWKLLRINKMRPQ